MDIQPVQQLDINQPTAPAKKPLKFGLSIAIVIICFVATSVAVYWIKTEPEEQTKSNVNISKANNDTANWKTFQSIDFGIQFKFPNDWEISSLTGSGNGVFKRSITQTYPDLDLPLDALINMREIDNVNAESLQRIFIDEYNNCLKEEEESPGMGCPGYEDISKWEKLNIVGKNAWRSGKRSTAESLPTDSVYIELNGKYLEIDAVYYNENYSNQLSLIFDQILSTFKFIK